MLQEIYNNMGIIGWIHFVAAVLSLITGTYVLFITKGTAFHKKVGYVYFVSMIIVIVTAFMIYRLFGGWGIFHWFACLSTFALVGGMAPMFKKNRTGKDLEQHAEVMGWSVVGLYCAFISETGSRLFMEYAMWIIPIGCGVTCFLGSFLIRKSKKTYSSIFGT